MDTGLTVRIKMFQVGELGDCFLLSFEEGASKSNVLIDCGSFRNNQASKNRLRAIIDKIKDDLGGKKLDVVASGCFFFPANEAKGNNST